MKNYFILFLSKWYCRVQIFLGLCLAMLFIFSSNNVFAYDLPTPTPISSYDYISFSVLSYNANMLQEDKIYPDKYPMVDLSIDKSRLGDGSSFYTTFYKSALINAIDEASSYFGSNLSVSSTVIDLYMNKFSDLYPFDPYNPQYCVNAFIDNAGNLYLCPDYTVSNRLLPLPNNWVTDSNGYIKCMPYGMLPFMVCDHIGSNLYYLGFSQYSDSLSNTEQFGICNGFQTTINGICFHSYSSPIVSTFSEIEFSSLIYNNNYVPQVYKYTSSGKYSWSSGYQINGSYLYPLVIMSKMFTCGDDVTNYSTNISYSFVLKKYNNYHVCFYVYPSLSNSIDLSQDEFYQFCVNWDINYWLKQFAPGLTFFNATFIDPAVLYTPTPFPTIQINATLTPIAISLDPDLPGITDGNLFGTVQGYIEMLVGVLNGPVPRFFSECISYVYASHFVFYIMLFVPVVVFIAFIIGRLRRK